MKNLTRVASHSWCCKSSFYSFHIYNKFFCNIYCFQFILLFPYPIYFPFFRWLFPFFRIRWPRCLSFEKLPHPSFGTSSCRSPLAAPFRRRNTTRIRCSPCCTDGARRRQASRRFSSDRICPCGVGESRSWRFRYSIPGHQATSPHSLGRVDGRRELRVQRSSWFLERSIAWCCCPYSSAHLSPTRFGTGPAHSAPPHTSFGPLPRKHDSGAGCSPYMACFFSLEDVRFPVRACLSGLARARFLSSMSADPPTSGAACGK